MLPHQERVVTERNELAERLAKLDAFLEGDRAESVPAPERGRLAVQSVVMSEYLDILNERIAAFKD